MKNSIVKVEDDFQEENEISIYDILNIFLKNIKLFIIVSVIGILITGIYIVRRIVYGKNNILTIEYTLNYTELESYLGGRVYYPRKEPNQILLEDEYLEKFFKNKELKELYEKKIKENRENINTKRNFLLTVGEENLGKGMLSNTKKGEANTYKITLKINKKDDINNEVSYSILNAYLEILKEYYDENIFKYIAERKKFSDERLPILKTQLEDNAVGGNALSFDKNQLTENNFLIYIYPVKVSNIDTYYPEYVRLESENQAIKTLLDLGLNNVNDFIQYDTSIIVENEKSDNLIKLGIGIFISLCLGILAIFIKEFFEGYKKNKENL